MAVTVEEVAQYVESLITFLDKNEAFAESWIREAFRKVPRHLFISQRATQDLSVEPVDPHTPTPDLMKLIYSDTGIVINLPNHSAASQPFLVAQMLGLLEIRRGLKVLEIGTGSGFNAGLMAQGTGDPGRVFSIDLQGDLVEAARVHLQDAGVAGVNLRVGDGGYGWPEESPFDRIVVTVGTADIPPAWPAQLAEGGILLVPFKTSGAGDPLLKLSKRDGEIAGAFVGYSGFHRLQGAFLDQSEKDWGELAELTEMEKTLLAKAPVKSIQGLDRKIADFSLFARSCDYRPEYKRSMVDDEVCVLVSDPDSGTVIKSSVKTKLISVHSEREDGGKLGLALEGWEQAGRPELVDYEAEVVDPTTTNAGAGEWIERRRSVCLRIGRRGKREPWTPNLAGRGVIE